MARSATELNYHLSKKQICVCVGVTTAGAVGTVRRAKSLREVYLLVQSTSGALTIDNALLIDRWHTPGDDDGSCQMVVTRAVSDCRRRSEGKGAGNGPSSHDYLGNQWVT